MLGLLSACFAEKTDHYYYYFNISTSFQPNLLYLPPLLCDQLQKAETSEADEVDEEPAVVQSAQLFAPKSLVLVSRLDYTEVFRVRTHRPVTNSSC